jgi:NAD(P)-dependent dehydrogenase (short-subunit alcohol dehydrogenase family)
LGQVAASIRAETGNDRLRTYLADFAALGEVKAMADRINTREPRLNVLINNAGTGGGLPFSKRELSKDDYELRFAVNYLAPYLLTHELLPLLKGSVPARIVHVASVGQQAIDFSNVMLNSGYGLARAYMQSKLAVIMMSFDLAEELQGSGVTSNALHPATFMNTKMTRRSLIPPTSTIKSGAKPTMRLAVSPELAGVTGRYFDQDHESRADMQAYDPGARSHLKELTEQLIAQVLQS